MSSAINYATTTEHMTMKNRGGEIAIDRNADGTFTLSVRLPDQMAIGVTIQRTDAAALSDWIRSSINRRQAE